ncbi:RNA polymerase II mediator complex subunit Sin4 [Xylaria bambusicola]|uniref:RNA polymerase II mediator complex subunit Sin4 n=1 Tax=Xylaria bambusicola TaxID=326684 RepID=UPI002007E692|nr:RNA polymerase II mediator complex subunit Sin4 [Xylaria bambusicola]KAI0526003.1 RNA polymerase II mediator complex subunit Sin4 [Xylaria bambusicola]
MTDTGTNMPLLLDSAMSGMDQPAMQVDLNGVDDLFGDTDPLSLPSRPPSRRLRRRLDELRCRGCCQGIAWSKGGTIASIAQGGQSIELRYLRANPKDANWELSEPKVVTPWQNLNGGPIVHLSWGPASSELAVIDAVGRVFLLNFNSDLNRPLVSRRWDGDTIDDLHTIVGTYWLNQLPANSRFYPIYCPAVKNAKGTDYTFETGAVPNMGPSHPNPTKSAFICVTTNGLLKMFWSQHNNKPEETTLELESATSADDLITHAAACSDKTKSIYIAMATTSKQLRVVQVAISFNSPKPENQQNIPPGGLVLSPSLGKRHVAVTSWFQTGICESPLDASMSKISHIEMLPAHFEIQTKQWSPIVVITVRSFIPESNSPYNHEVQSIIDRWELLTDQKQTVHPAFERLGPRRNSVGSTPPATARLKKLESIIVNKIVMGVNVVSFGKTLCFYYNDGTVEYRDRFTMQEVHREANLDRMYSILEAGFTHSGEPSCLQMAFSPVNFSLVQMYEDGQIKWHNLEYTLEDPTKISDAHLNAVIAACAMSTATATNNNTNIDDIFAVARKFPHRDQFAVKWVMDLVQIMRITVDYSDDIPHDHLIRNQHLQFCFSIFNHLGWNGEFSARHFRSRLSTLALSLRNTVILVSLASSAPSAVRAASMPLDEPEVVNSLAGCAKWSCDFLSWLCDSLFCLLDDIKFMSFLTQTNQPQQLLNLTQYLHTKNEIALHLILCSSTRNLISAACRRVGLLDSCASRALAWYSGRGELPESSSSRHVALHAAYRKVHRYTSAALVKADEFDKFLGTLAGDIRSAYGTSLGPLAEKEAQKAAKNPPTPNQNPNAPKSDRVKEARQLCELNMLLVRPPPPSFLAVITKLFRQDLMAFRTNVDLAKLYFADYRLLEIIDTPDALADRKKRGMNVDMFRRVEISKRAHVPWRRCSRCGNVMEDLTSPNNKPGMLFLLAQQRTCCCGGRLALLT